MIQIKKEYHNGIDDVIEIYSEFKLFETPTKDVWNATEENPITIPKKRLKEFLETTEPVEPEIEKESEDSLINVNKNN